MTQTILLLEDDLQLSDTVKRFLELKGYRVLVAYDGVQAEDIVYEKHIDLMLLDVKVPLVNGFEFLQKVRSEGREIPAIFITSLNSTEDVEKGFAAGCDDYIRKPFALKEMLVRVEALLKRSFGTHEAQVVLGEGLVFDIKSLLLTQNNQKVPLKTKELKLLALFLQHPNELLAYEKIYETLWEYDEAPSPGSLRTYIKRIRAVIGREKVETIKNVGYRFVTQ
jgi:DNA-binding response OmpR family regulator